MKNDFRARNHPAYWAFLTHRTSGVALTLFLPLHFWALGSALQGEAKLETFLRWSDQPLVKCAEVILVLLLAAHMAGGVRLLMVEFMESPVDANAWHKTLLAVSAGVSVAIGLIFLLNLV
jgi:fumarate reductase subunit D